MIIRLLEMSVNFISSNDTGEIRAFFVWSDNEEIRSGNETNDIIKKRFKSFLTNYQNEERISSIKPFIDQYNWEGIDFPSGIKDWKKFERNNKTIALNILFIPHNTKTINLAYKSKYNRKRENQVVLLMITNGKQSDKVDKWHYIALKIVHTDDGFNPNKKFIKII